MSTLGHHVILRLGDDRVIAPSRAARRAWARQLAALCEALPILVWRLADTHLHILVLGPRSVADELIRRLRIWVTRALRPGVPLEVQRTKPLAGQSHLESAFHYVLRQDEHHGITTDPHHQASALPEILSLRRCARRCSPNRRPPPSPSTRSAATRSAFARDGPPWEPRESWACPG